jgi:hypothetical protein
MAFVRYDYPTTWTDQIMEFFTFDYHKPECCTHLPFADETVLHIRGFEIELAGYISLDLFHELDPMRTAHELLGHLKGGDKVAVVSRFSEKNVSEYMMALKNRGLRVRYVSGLNGIQTFCFLLSASKEIVGMRKSTFFRWAAILNRQARSVIMYCMNYTQNRCHETGDVEYRLNTWKSPVFQL